MSRARGKVETREYGAFARRAISGYGRRISQGDVDALPGLLELRQHLNTVTEEAISALRHEPNNYSWQRIADVLGVSKQACQQRWQHLGTDRKAGGQIAFEGR